MNRPTRDKNYGCKVILLFLILIMSALPTSAAWCFSNEECIDCHSQASEKSSKTIDIDAFLSSVHGEEISCAECHQQIRDETHMEKKGSGVVDCSTCHQDMGHHGNDLAIACYACHTRHNMYPASDTRSSLHWKKLDKTCGQCHLKQVERPKGFLYLTAFQVASHPKESFYYQYSKSMCISCHQGAAAHGEATPIDNSDCYKCHMGLGSYAGALGYTHGPQSTDLYYKLSIIGVHIAAVLILLALFLCRVFNISPARFFNFKKKSDTWPTLPPL